MKRNVLLLTVFLSSFCMASQDFDLNVEIKMHYRDSEENRFPTSFPFPPELLPAGEDSAFLETVDAGTHTEISTISMTGKWSIAENTTLLFKIDAIDKYDRNPTSSDHEIDLDSFIIRYGTKPIAMKTAERFSYYVQTGKFAKFERQRERRSESYGLVSTAFNRFEDSGIEVGADSARGVYARASLTTGNPVFLRDPNALAGDNGTKERSVPPENPNPALKSGIVMLYDAEIESFDLSENPELGIGLGFKWHSDNGSHLTNMLIFHYERELAEDQSLNGTFYGADLDLLDLGEVPGAEGIRLPIKGDHKRESGINFWYSAGNFALFAQHVNQDIASLGRKGTELELSYLIDSLVPFAPVVRYSKIDHDFVGTSNYPAPSVWWDWEKFDYAINIDFSKSVRLILEYSDNRFIRGGKEADNNETLLTLRLRY